MLSLRKPTLESIRAFLAVQGKLELTYSAIGATATTPPSGYVDHTRVKLGEGEQVYEAANAALSRWDQFRLSWLEAGPRDTPIRKGEVVAIVAKANGLWWMNACRIVSVIDEQGANPRFGFAYGTLPDHVGTGEERFLVEWQQSDNSVWYDILAFSRPNHILAKIGYPLVRRTQKRFGRDSSAAMRAAVADSHREQTRVDS
jgi:uncharacterized protein (UPF0548 family)